MVVRKASEYNLSLEIIPLDCGINSIINHFFIGEFIFIRIFHNAP